MYLLHVLTRHPDVLQLGHQLAVEATHGVASQEPEDGVRNFYPEKSDQQPAAFLLEVMVNPSELTHQRVLAVVVLLGFGHEALSGNERAHKMIKAASPFPKKSGHEMMFFLLSLLLFLFLLLLLFVL